MDARFLVLAAAAGVAVVIAVAAGYVWGARKSAVSVAATVRAKSEAATSPQRPRAAADALRPADRMRLPIAPPSSVSAGPEEAATLSPEEGRAKHIGRLTSSGPDTRGLLSDARRVGDEWSDALAAQGLEVAFDDWYCFKAGCFVSAKHASAETVDTATDVITHSRAFTHWNGEKIRTGPVLMAGGKTDVTWILLPPPEGEAAIVSELAKEALNPPRNSPH
jgi:hypothetical protein